MDNLLRKMQDDKIGFDMKIDEVREREIDEYNYQREVIAAYWLSTSMCPLDIANFLKLPYDQVRAMIKQIDQRQRQIEQEQERAHLEFLAEIYEENGIREYEALSAEELLQDEENIRKYETTLSTAEKLLAENVDLDYIAKVTGWGVNQIKALQYQIQKDLVKVFTAN